MHARTTVDARAIANAVLYDGYVLYPYRPAAAKAPPRVTAGILVPEAIPAAPPGITSSQQTECIVLGHAWTAIEITVRFLHLMLRDVLPPPLDAPEATDVDVIVPPQRLRAHADRPEPWRTRFACPATKRIEQTDVEIVRIQKPLEGRVELWVTWLAEQVFKITVRVVNTTPLRAKGEVSPDDLLLSSLVSTHAILALDGGEFVSCLEPPSVWREFVAGCRNVGTWPVLAGHARRRDVMLALPVRLQDYPELSPTSADDSVNTPHMCTKPSRRTESRRGLVSKHRRGA